MLTKIKGFILTVTQDKKILDSLKNIATLKNISERPSEFLTKVALGEDYQLTSKRFLEVKKILDELLLMIKNKENQHIELIKFIQTIKLEKKYPGIVVKEIKYDEDNIPIDILTNSCFITNDELIQFIDGNLDDNKTIKIISELKTNTKLRKVYNEYFKIKSLLAESYEPIESESFLKETDNMLEFANFLEADISKRLKDTANQKIKNEYSFSNKIKKNLFQRLNIKILIPTAAILGGLAAPILAPSFTMQMAMRSNEIQIAKVEPQIFEIEEEFLIRGSEKDLNLEPEVEYSLRYKNSDGFMVTILLEKITQKNESCLKIKHGDKENIVCGNAIVPFLLDQKK